MKLSQYEIKKRNNYAVLSTAMGLGLMSFAKIFDNDTATYVFYGLAIICYLISIFYALSTYFKSLK